MKYLKLTDKILLATVALFFLYITGWMLWVDLHWDQLIPLMLN